jgi:hypothetical protein
MTARVTSAARQPCTDTSHAASGTKIVLAKPASSVTSVRARARSRRNHTIIVANAGP